MPCLHLASAVKPCPSADRPGHFWRDICMVLRQEAKPRQHKSAWLAWRETYVDLTREVTCVQGHQNPTSRGLMQRAKQNGVLFRSAPCIRPLDVGFWCPYTHVTSPSSPFEIAASHVRQLTRQLTQKRRLSGPTIVGQADHCGSLWYGATYLFPHPLGYDMIGDYYDCWRSDKPKCVEA